MVSAFGGIHLTYFLKWMIVGHEWETEPSLSGEEAPFSQFFTLRLSCEDHGTLVHNIGSAFVTTWKKLGNQTSYQLNLFFFPFHRIQCDFFFLVI